MLFNIWLDAGFPALCRTIAPAVLLSDFTHLDRNSCADSSISSVTPTLNEISKSTSISRLIKRSVSGKRCYGSGFVVKLEASLIVAGNFANRQYTGDRDTILCE